MESSNWKLSERVVFAVADTLGKDPLELPPLERTLSADALDYLFHQENYPPGAHTIFPYCGLWVVVHSSGAVDVFENYRGSVAGRLGEDRDEPPDGDRVVLHFDHERHVFYEDQLERLHEIIAEADDCDDAWQRAVEYARE